MKHVSSLCVVCNLCYSKWCYIWPNFGHCTTSVNVWERIGENTLSTTLHILRDRGRVNPIFSTHIAEDALSG